MIKSIEKTEKLISKFGFTASINSGKHFINGVEYVDLDLPSGKLWATKNVGADDIILSGDYMAFDKARNYKYPNGWELPSKFDFQELLAHTYHRWLNVNGAFGEYFRSIKNIDKWMFIPASGYKQSRFQGEIYNTYSVGGYAFLWGSDISAQGSNFALSLTMTESNRSYVDVHWRQNLFTIRTVYNGEKILGDK